MASSEDNGRRLPPSASNGFMPGMPERAAMAGCSRDVDISERHRRLYHSHLWAPLLMNVCRSFRVTGVMDASRLRTAINDVSARQPVLRTTYHADGEERIRASLHSVLTPGWAVHDLTDLPGQARRLRLEVLAQREFGCAFDLATDAPLRVTLVRIGPNEHVVLVVAHVIAWDSGSFAVFFSDLTNAYRGEKLGQLDPPPAWAPYDTEADLRYWRQAMTDPPEPLELPGPHGTVVPSSWRCCWRTARLSEDTLARVRHYAHEAATTVDTVLLAAFCALIFRYTHASDFLVANQMLSRDDATEGRIGHYNNGIAVRVRPRSAQSFEQLLGQVHHASQDGRAHQLVNFNRVMAELNPDRRYSVGRFARVGFTVTEPSGPGFCVPGVRCERADLRRKVAPLPLNFTVEPDDKGAIIEAECLIEVLDARLLEHLLRNYTVVLESALADAGRPLAQLELMDSKARAWLSAVAAGRRYQAASQVLGDLVAIQTAHTPDAVAIVYEGRHYPYREINETANRVAHWLIQRGIGTEDLVAVRLAKSPELAITALGVMKAGATYLPIDPDYPDDQVAYILADASPKYVVNEPITDLSEASSVEPTNADRVRPLAPDNTAYLIYTSGSHGLLKGVLVPHRPVVEYLTWLGDEYEIDQSERLLQVASPGFDVSIGEIFGILSSGGRLVIPRPGGLGDISYLTDLLHREEITSMHVVPSLLALFLSLPGVAQWRSLRWVPIGGEELQGDLADRFNITFDAVLDNFYGPAEAVISASRYKVRGRQGTRVVPIGLPKINTQIYVLDNALQPVPEGVIGEIYIGGTHLARGYHGRPGLTAERFIANPFCPGGRLYRSGDLARRNAQGDLEYVGRADEQVKVRGYRIELGEVSRAIAVDPSVGQAVVLVEDLPHLDRSLVAYLTPAPGHEVNVARVRERVAAALADYKVPADYVVLDEMPVTSHGTIDRMALPTPELATTAEFHRPGGGPMPAAPAASLR